MWNRSISGTRLCLCFSLLVFGAALPSEFHWDYSAPMAEHAAPSVASEPARVNPLNALPLVRRAGTKALQRSKPHPALLNPRHPLWSKHSPEVFRARFETSKGAFVVITHRSWAPLGVDRFYNLIRVGFYDDSRFFRVRPGYIVQFGIAGEPAIADVWKNQAIDDDTRKETNVRGSFAYAMTGPGTRTTQIYINLADNTQLDAQGFAPLGKVVEGMEVVDRLYGGYGEDAGGGMRAGKQGHIFEGGNKFMDKNFPKLDKLIRVRIL